MRPGGGTGNAGAPAGYPGGGGRAPGVEGPNAGVIGPGAMAGGGNTAAKKAPDYSNPQAAVETFLQAVQEKDSALLSEVVALRAEYEAATEAKKAMFKSLRDENLPDTDIDELARHFEGMKLTNQLGSARSSATRGVVVGKQDENKLITCTVLVRKEKDGWKVVDFSKHRIERTGLRQTTKKGGGNG